MNHVGIHPIEKYGRPLETAVYSRYFPAIKNEKMDGNEVKLVGEWPPKRAERRIEWPLDLNLKPWNDRGELRRGAAGWRWRRWRLLTWWRTPPVAMTTSPLAPVDNPSVTSPPTSCYDNAATLHRCHDDPYSLPPPTPPPTPPQTPPPTPPPTPPHPPRYYTSTIGNPTHTCWCRYSIKGTGGW